MRILSLPLALVLSACLYPSFPGVAKAIAEVFQALYAHFLPLFTRKSGKADEEFAFALFLLIVGGVCQLIGGLHILLAGALMAPVLCVFVHIPQAIQIKQQLDSGVYARRAGEYDARVRSACAALGPAFVTDMCAPLLLIALGTPIHMGCALGGAYFAARALCDRLPAARRMIALLNRPAWQVLRALLLLCSGLVGRNPAHAHGDNARSLLLSILGIAGDTDDTHIPVSGDITQALFLCLFCTAMLTLLLCILLLSFC